MLYTLSLAAVGLLVMVAICHVWFWSRLSAVLAKRYEPVSDDKLPKVAVVLTLRGADPFLDRCLRGVFQQDYPSHEIRVIVDSTSDPAWDVVQSILSEVQPTNVTVEALEAPASTCSLRMSALLQAYRRLDESVDVIAWCDADALPHPGWLRALVTPFTVDENVGVTCGIRWFMPQHSTPGTLVRFIWNSAAIQQMAAFRIGWGGAMAVRLDAFREAGLTEKWAHVMFEDTYTTNEIQGIGKKLVQVGELVMVNREACRLRGCITFISRQLLNARFYHRSWPKVLAFAVFSAATVLFFTAVATGALWLRDVPSLKILGITLGIYLATLGILTKLVELRIARQCRERGDEVTPMSPHMLWATALTHIVYPIAVLQSLTTRTIEWRGIRYIIGGPQSIQLVEYKPFKRAAQASSAESL